MWENASQGAYLTIVRVLAVISDTYPSMWDASSGLEQTLWQQAVHLSDGVTFTLIHCSERGRHCPGIRSAACLAAVCRHHTAVYDTDTVSSRKKLFKKLSYRRDSARRRRLRHGSLLTFWRFTNRIIIIIIINCILTLPESPYATSYRWIIQTYIQSRSTVFQLSRSMVNSLSTGGAL